MAFEAITDEFWNQVPLLLEPFKRERSGGHPPLDFRFILNEMLSVLKTRCQWSCLPCGYGSKSRVHEPFQKRTNAGVMAEIFRLQAEVYQEKKGMEWGMAGHGGDLGDGAGAGGRRCA